MSNMVSIAELTPSAHRNYPDVTDGDRPILWDMELPRQVDAEKITVDMSRLKRIHAVGAIAASFVEDSNEVESGEMSVGICTDPFDCTTGFLTKKVNLNAIFGRPAVTHWINTAEFAKRTADNTSSAADASPEATWARLYDEAIRGSMVQAARQHLMARKENVSKTMTALSYIVTGTALAGLAGGLAGVVPGESAIEFIGAYTSMQTAPQIVSEKNRSKGDTKLLRRASIVPMNRQPDRYALTWALCRKSGLVRATA